ncbi:sensor histidine kinase, partial [Lutibacter sp.]
FYPIYTGQVNNEIILTSLSKTYILTKNKWKIVLENKYREYAPLTYVKNKNISFFETSLDSITIFNNEKTVLTSFEMAEMLKSSHKRSQLTDSLFYWIDKSNYYILNFNTLKLHKRNLKNEINIESSKHTRINLINEQLQITGTGFVGILDENYHITNTVYIPKKLNSHFALIDTSKNVWIATFANGIYKLPHVKKNIKYSLVDKKTGQFNNVNTKLIVTVFNKGYYKYDTLNSSFIPHINEDDFVFNPTYINELQTEFYPSKKSVKWIRNSKLDTVKPTKQNSFGIDLAKQFIYFNTNLYSIYPIGIYKLDTKNLTILNEYPQLGVNHLTVFNNQLLIATTNGLKKKEDTLIKPITFNGKPFNKSILKITKLSNSEVLLNTDGFGTYITNLKTITQLPNSEFLIVQNAFIENKNIWLATDIGVLKYTKINGSYALKKQYGLSNGLPSKNINDITITKKSIIVSTNNGIAVIPKQQESNTQFLDIYVDKASYNNTILSDNSSFQYTKNNTTNFSISSINFSEGNSTLNYKYKLHPIQKKWISTSSNNLIFNNLLPKKYTLELEIYNITKSYQFKITPLWWQRTISKIGFSIIALFSFGFILLQIRNRELRKKTTKLKTQKQLAEYELHALRSQMNPHFVFNSLNAIQYYITKNEIELSEKYLVQFSRLIRKFFDFSRDKFITLKQEISLLKNYLDVEKMRFGKDFNYKFNIDKTLNLNEQKIPTMLLQPIVENAVNHGLFHNEGKGLIKIEFLKNPLHDFIVKISDNGVGLKKAQEIKENSIKTHISKSNSILKDRINLLNQSKEWHVTYSINELENTTGTIVKLTFKHYEN